MSYLGSEIVYYDKSSYCWQSNDALVGTTAISPVKHIYYIGDEQNHIFPDTSYPLLANLFITNVSSEICYDLSCGARVGNKWNNGKGTAKLHIFVSNTTLSGDSPHLPTNIITACADPYGTMLLGTSTPFTVVFKNDGNTNAKIIYSHITDCFYYNTTQYNITTTHDIIL